MEEEKEQKRRRTPLGASVKLRANEQLYALREYITFFYIIYFLCQSPSEKRERKR